MRRHSVPRRPVIFIGVEGESERAFARFIGRRCERKGLHLFLDVRPADGGDSVAVVEAAARYLSRYPAKNDFRKRLVLLDNDRVARDRKSGRDALVIAAKHSLEIVFQDPNLEGLLLRLHPGYESRQIQAEDAMRELRKVWPDYRKPPTVDQLDRRFGLPDLARTAKHDRHLKKFLEALGLL